MDKFEWEHQANDAHPVLVDMAKEAYRERVRDIVRREDFSQIEPWQIFDFTNYGSSNIQNNGRNSRI